MRSLIRANGLVFIGTTLAMIATLIAGLFITCWFTAPGAAIVESEAAFRLTTIEVCALSSCVSTPSWNLPDAFGVLVVPLIVAGVAFGAVVLRIAHARIQDHEVGRLLRALAYALAVAVVGLALACMFFAAPAAMSYDISVAPNMRSFLPRAILADHVSGVTQAPSLGAGGFLVLVAVFAGTFLAYGASPEPYVTAPHVPGDADDGAPRRRFREEPMGPQRGPETDPFRAPPAPRPIGL
ncbi:MAG: hypothetical protein KIT31_42415, partial [Deltaproteobacteria bacterium]|nr:hypothetical protein [Deltaproteobacteria bacterium]